MGIFNFFKPTATVPAPAPAPAPFGERDGFAEFKARAARYCTALASLREAEKRANNTWAKKKMKAEISSLESYISWASPKASDEFSEGLVQAFLAIPVRRDHSHYESALSLCFHYYAKHEHKIEWIKEKAPRLSNPQGGEESAI